MDTPNPKRKKTSERQERDATFERLRLLPDAHLPVVEAWAF